MLSQAAQAFQISEEDARRLDAEGTRPQPVGLQIEPNIQILVVSEERRRGIATRRELAIRLTAELLTARYLAVVLWPGERPEGSPL